MIANMPSTEHASDCSTVKITVKATVVKITVKATVVTSTVKVRGSESYT